MSLAQIDRKFLGRESEAEDVQVARTDGAFLYDARGRKYIDFVAGWCVGNRGWGDAQLRKAARRARAVDYVYPEYLYAPWAELAELLASIAPGKLRKSYRTTGGTEAVDIALQIAMAATGRRKFISLEGAYHGNSIGTVSIGDEESRQPYPNRLTGIRQLKPPLDERAAARAEKMLEARDVAAVVMEPISCNLGVLIPDGAFMSRLAALCRRYGTLLVMDEVACGFGRTGKLFATEHFDIEPDILCLAKAITGGYAPMGATIVTEKVAKAIAGEVGFYSTYGWHPLSTDVAIANVRWWISHGEKLLKKVNALSEHFSARLAAMTGGPLHIKGFAIAAKLGDEKKVEDVVARCKKNGLLLTSAGDALTMFPPLTLDRKTADAALDILEGALRRTD